MRIDADEYLKLQELKKEHNLSEIFRNALNEFYEEHFEKK